MKRGRIDSIGFTNGNMARFAEKIIRTGVGVVVGGVLLAAFGLKVMTNTQEWYQPVNEDGQESIRKLHDSIEVKTIN